jgi:hypothetical protein
MLRDDVGAIVMNALDPKNPMHKSQIKASLVDAIAKDLADIDRDEIVRKVESEYERLLAGALIVAHIPSLTNGSVRRSIRHHPRPLSAVR